MYLPTMTNSEILAYLRAQDLNEIETELVRRLEASEEALAEAQLEDGDQ